MQDTLSVAIQKKKRHNPKTKWGYIFLIPWLLLFIIFTAYPFFDGIFVAFTDYDLSGMHFVGLQNFINMPSDPAFVNSLIATFFYALIIIPVSIALSLWIANALRYHGPKMNSFSKAVFYMPGVACTTSLVIVWNFMVSPSTGMVASFFSAIGLPQYSLFDRPSTSIPTLSLLVILCSLGQLIIIYAAAMNGIPVSYYEAAELDGASRSKQFFEITLPLVKPTSTFILITQTISVLQIFVVPYLMTQGGPEYKTSTLLLMIYNSAFLNDKFGYASAIGVVLFVIIALIAAAQFKAMRSEPIEY
jgi:ABC-type sugar transport system permease subunit